MRVSSTVSSTAVWYLESGQGSRPPGAACRDEGIMGEEYAIGSLLAVSE